MRLELEKKLAAASQKFADAARLSSELKALSAKLDASRANQAAISAQVEAERVAQEGETSRESDLMNELRSEQKEVRMCACVRVRLCACALVCMCACVRVRLCACALVCVCACVRVRAFSCLFARARARGAARGWVGFMAMVHACTFCCACLRVGTVGWAADGVGQGVWASAGGGGQGAQMHTCSSCAPAATPDASHRPAARVAGRSSPPRRMRLRPIA